MESRVKLIEALSNARGISGFEDEVVEVIREAGKEYLDFSEDTLRNLYLTLKGKESKNKLKVMIDGHSDEVGFMVQAIKNNGLMKFLPVGGWIPYNSAAQKVKVRNSQGDYISGIISSKPPHFMSEAERNKSVDFTSLFIDVGASSREEVIEKFKIEVGAPVVPDVSFEFNKINDTMIGKAFDNRLGCACVMETLKALKDSDIEADVVGTISSQEESGLRGAVVSARKVKPDVAIVFEGTPSDDSFASPDEAQAVLKKGAQIRHMDRSMITHPRFVKFARNVAKEKQIKFQDAVRSGGGTNGGSIHLSNLGVPTIVIGIPVRYIHTHYGITAIEDFNSGVQWAVEIIKGLSKDIVNEY